MQPNDEKYNFFDKMYGYDVVCFNANNIYIFNAIHSNDFAPTQLRSARNRAYEWIIITNNNKNTEYPIYSLPVHFSFIFFAARLNKIGLEQSWCVNIE